MKFNFKINKQMLKYGSISTLFAIFFIAALILVNVLVNFATTKYSLKLDMTTTSEYKLDAQTEKLLSGLDGKITIYILATENSMKKSQLSNRVLETIYRYNTKSGGKVKYQFVDPNKNPAFFEKYTRANGAEEKALVVEGPLRYIVVKSSEFAWNEGDNKNKVYYGIEEKLSSAIMYTTSKDLSKAAIITGHEEEEPAALSDIFDGNNFERVSVNLSSADIPAGVNNVVISAPKVDFTASEIAKIDAYLKVNGHNLYVLWNMNTPKCDVLERYLTEWGLSFGDQLVLDSKDAYQSPIVVIPTIAQNDVTQNMDEGQLRILSPRTMPIGILWNERSYTRVVPLLQTGSTSYAKAMLADKNITDFSQSGNDTPGPFDIAAMSERNAQTGTQMTSSRIFAFGSSDIASKDISSISVAYNNKFLTGIIQYANPSTNTMVIAPKVAQDYDLNITQATVGTIRNILIIIPLLILLAGLIVFFRRRHK